MLGYDSLGQYAQNSAYSITRNKKGQDSIDDSIVIP